MSSDSSLPQNADGSSEAPSASGSHQQTADPAGFGSLARKITRRTTDLFAIAIVLAVGLSVGGSLVDWWRTDPDEASPDFQPPLAAMQWGAAGRTVALRFGAEGSALSRQTVAGDRRTADQALRAVCRRIVVEQPAPTGPPDERERRFLDSLRKKKPIESEPGRWRLYRINAPVLMIVGIGGAPGDRSPVHRERVLCWGLAFPTTAASWVLYTFRPSGDDSGRTATVGEIPLPPGSRRIVSARDRSAGEFCLFAGTGPPEVWMRFFDRWFKGQGEQVVPRWHQADERWWTRFVVFGNRKSAPTGTVEINIQRNTAGQWTGMVSLLPGARKRGR